MDYKLGSMDLVSSIFNLEAQVRALQAVVEKLISKTGIPPAEVHEIYRDARKQIENKYSDLGVKFPD